MLSDRWWFWALVAGAVALGALGSTRYRDWAAHLRARALARRLVEPGTGRRIDTRPGGFWSDTSWLLVLLGAWVAGSPWIWGYDSVHGAIAADAITGAAVIALSAAGIVLPPFNALTVLAGLWLVLAPWLVGYGDEASQALDDNRHYTFFTDVPDDATHKETSRDSRAATPTRQGKNGILQ